MIDPASTRFIAIDTETTGLDPRKGARLTEIAAVTVFADRILEDEVFQELINPGVSIPLSISKLTGITNEMVKGKPDIKEVLERFFAWVPREAILVFHNAPFDLSFLNHFSEEYRLEGFENAYCDTVELWASLRGGRSRLDTILSHFGIVLPHEMRHRAIGDALGTALAFIKLAESIGPAALKRYIHSSGAWNRRPRTW